MSDCKSCIWWFLREFLTASVCDALRQAHYGPDTLVGDCRKHAPALVHVLDPRLALAVWPLTIGDETCGDYRERGA